MPSTAPGSTYHVVGRSAGESRFDRYGVALYEGPDRSEAEDAYLQGIEVAKLAHAATVTLYRQTERGLRIEKRFDGAAYRAALAKPALAAGSALQAVGAALGGAL